MVSPLTSSYPAEIPALVDHDAPPPPRPRVLDGGAMRLNQAIEEQRLSRLGTDVLRQLVVLGRPSTQVLAGYLGMTIDELGQCIAGARRLPRGARRNLARVALAFAPSGVRHTAKRLLEGELTRLMGR